MRPTALAILALLALPVFADHGKIKWRAGKDHDTALAEAKGSGVPVLIYFTSDTWGPCKALGAGAFNDDDVVKASERVIRIVADAGQDSKLFTKYGVQSMPTWIFLDADGKKLKQLNPQNSASTLVSLFNEIADANTRGPKWMEGASAALDAGKADRKLVMLVFADEKKSANFMKTFGDAAYKDVFEKVAAARVEFKKDSDECKKWKVIDPSTVLLIDATGDEPKVLKTVKGPKSPKDLKKDLEDAIKKIPGETK